MVGEDDQIKAGFAVIARRYGVTNPTEGSWLRFQSWCQGDQEIVSNVDCFLWNAACRGGIFAWLASAYAGRFHRLSALRRREVAVLAFLECLPESAEIVDRSHQRGPFAAWICFLWWGFIEALGVLLSLPIFGLVHLCGGRR